MCNRYRLDTISAEIAEILQRWDEDVDSFDQPGRNSPEPVESFPNTPGRIVTRRDGRLRISEALWGMPTPPQFLVTKTGKPMAYDPGVTNVRNAASPHWRRWLGVEHRCLVPWTRFCEPDQASGSRRDTWFRLADGQEVAFFAGIRDDLTRQIKAKDPEPTEGAFYAFLTTTPNAEVAAVHPKAMPVILKTPEECRQWLTADWPEAKALQRPLPDGALRIVQP